jgi:hypothetical protein
VRMCCNANLGVALASHGLPKCQCHASNDSGGYEVVLTTEVHPNKMATPELSSVQWYPLKCRKPATSAIANVPGLRKESARYHDEVGPTHYFSSRAMIQKTRNRISSDGL